METLEHRFYFSDRPYLWILAKTMPNANADDFHIRRVERNTDKEELIRRMLTEPVDAVYTDIYDPEFLYSIISMGVVLYFPERYGKSWPVKKFGTTVYTLGGVASAFLHSCRNQTGSGNDHRNSQYGGCVDRSNPVHSIKKIISEQKKGKAKRLPFF